MADENEPHHCTPDSRDLLGHPGASAAGGRGNRDRQGAGGWLPPLPDGRGSPGIDCAPRLPFFLRQTSLILSGEETRMSTAAEPLPFAEEITHPTRMIANVPGRLGPWPLNVIRASIGLPWNRRVSRAALLV